MFQVRNLKQTKMRIPYINVLRSQEHTCTTSVFANSVKIVQLIIEGTLSNI